MNKQLIEYCTDCGRKANGEVCTKCGLTICRFCIQSKKEYLCDDCFYNDDVWMEDDENYLDG